MSDQTRGQGVGADAENAQGASGARAAAEGSAADAESLIRAEPDGARPAECAAVNGTEQEVERAVQAEEPRLPHLPITEVTREIRGDKPMLRGWLHAVSFPLALASGIVLITLAHGLWPKLACAVYMASSIMLFGNSAVYHIFNWGPRVKLVLKRIDHSNILLLIAGTYTPLATMTLPPTQARTLLLIVWSAALAGILFRVFWIGAPRWLYVVIYLLLGWGAVMYVPAFYRANPATMILVIVGGLLYSIGAVVYALKKPNPFPKVFGFHEVFHSFTVLAFACHAVAIYLVTV